MTDLVTRKQSRGRLANDPAARALAAENPHRLHSLAAALGPIPNGDDLPIPSLERISLAAYCGHKPSQVCWPGLAIVMGDEESGARFWADTGALVEEGSFSPDGHGPTAMSVSSLASRWGPIAATAAILPLLKAAQVPHALDPSRTCACSAAAVEAFEAYEALVKDPKPETLDAAAFVPAQIGPGHRWLSDLSHYLAWSSGGHFYLAGAAQNAIQELSRVTTDPDREAMVLIRIAGVRYALGLA